jgi:hypothetical protein
MIVLGIVNCQKENQRGEFHEENFNSRDIGEIRKS